MKLLSNAKINIGLYVLNKREDGFHAIESLFVPIEWHDEISITKSSTLNLSSSGIIVDTSAENNLCLMAYQLLKTDFDLPAVQIQLNKQIPVGAGLGGGSSNAAFVLKGLNELFQLNLTIQQLEAYADKLGSDCSFFIQNKPALVSGKGENINTNIQFSLSAYCLVVYPNLHISTKKAYELVKPQSRTTSIENLINLPLEQWRGKLINDFEKPILEEFPILLGLKQQLNDMGATYVSMSGSGSTFFALFKEEPTINVSELNFSSKIMKLNF